MTGKLADTVMSVRNGEQIARKYQPVVYNPSTPAQVAQRAKLKLLSQLSAVMAPVIAIRRKGNVSARNLFTKVNFGATSFEDNQATITLTEVSLTDGILGMRNLSVIRAGFSAKLSIAAGADPKLSRVVYVAFRKQSDGTLRMLDSVAATEPGETFTYEAEIGIESESATIVVYAYGIRDNNENARVSFSNLQALTAETVAKIITQRTLTESDITLTETVAVESAPTNANINPVPAPDDENRASKKK